MSASRFLWGCTDMIISKTRYQALQEIIADQNTTIQNLKHYIALLETENKALKQCLKYSVSNSDIDFPNSTKGGFEDSNIFLM